MERQLREASEYDIADNFRGLGRLWASEQAEGDDEGIAQIEAIAASLREFMAHEKTEQEQPVYLPSDYCGCW